MTAPYLGQMFDADTVGVTLGSDDWLIVRLDPDGSRRIVHASNMFLGSTYPTWEGLRDFWLDLWDNDPIMFWGEWEARFGNRIRAGAGTQFMPYPPADGIPVEPVDDPPNQIAHLQRVQGNAAVSAHDLQVTLGNDILRSRNRRRLQHRQVHLYPHDR